MPETLHVAKLVDVYQNDNCVSSRVRQLVDKNCKWIQTTEQA